MRREAGGESRWVLLDYLDFVVHVQHCEARPVRLERLWKDCPRIDLVPHWDTSVTAMSAA